MRKLALCLLSIFLLIVISRFHQDNQIRKPNIVRTEKSTSDGNLRLFTLVTCLAESPRATSVLLVRASNKSVETARIMLREFDRQFNEVPYFTIPNQPDSEISLSHYCFSRAGFQHNVEI
jgi:hypothetical protein